MTHDAVAAVRRAARRRFVMGGGVIAVLALVFARSLCGPADTARFQRRLAELEAAGFATTEAGLRGGQLDPSENGAELLSSAFSVLVEERGLPAMWEVIGPWSSYDLEWCPPSDPDELAAVRALVSELDPFFAKADDALARSALRWDLTRGAGTAARDDYCVSSVTALLHADAIVGATPERRLRAAERLLRLGERIVPMSPRHYSDVVGASRSGLRAFRSLLVSRGVPASELAAALARESPRERLPSWPDVVRTDIVWLAELGRSLPGDDGCRKFMQLPRRWSFPLCRVIDATEACVSIDVSDYASAAARVASVEPAPWRGMILGAPSTWAVRRFAAYDASLRILRMSVAATVRRDRDGHWPASVAELAPDFGGALPVDPTTRSPFVYEISSGALRLTLPADSALRTNERGMTVSDATLADEGLDITVTR